MNFTRLFAFACLLFLAGALPSARAHEVASVELEFQQLDHHWRLLGEMDVAYMLPETRNVPGGPPLSRAAVMQFPPAELARIRRETETTLRKLIRLTFAGKDLSWRVEFPDFEKEPFVLPPDAGDIALLTTRLVIDALPGAGELRVHWSGEQETELIILTEDGDDAKIVSTLPGGNLMLLKQTGSGKSAPVEKPVTGGWLQLGYSHVLPKGLDHLLFILGLFLMVPKWKPLLGQSLLFTLAHSVALALAVFGWVHLPAKPVEVLIAMSIAFIGIENLFTRKIGKQRLILVFGFGLVHGLGFASVLADKVKGIPRAQLAGPLLGFNIGVELAQITVLAAALVVFRPMGKWTRLAQTTGSTFVALAGIAWAIQRLLFPQFPIMP